MDVAVCRERVYKDVGKKKDAVGQKTDVVRVSCHKNKSGTVKVNVDDRKKIWN